MAVTSKPISKQRSTGPPDHPSVVYIAEDDRQMGESVRWILEGAGYITVLATSGEELLAIHDDSEEGCLLLDLQLPDISGMDLLAKLRSQGCRRPFIMLTGHGDVSTAVQSLHSGAIDYIEKPFARKRLLKRVAEAVACDRAKRSIRKRLDKLTARENQVLRCVVAGQSSKEIADVLTISPRTVDVHRSNLLQKMGFESIAQLVHEITRYAEYDY